MYAANECLLARSTENAVDDCADDGDIMNDADRHIFIMSRNI